MIVRVTEMIIFFFQRLWTRKVTWRNVIIKRGTIYDFKKNYFWKLNHIWSPRLWFWKGLKNYFWKLNRIWQDRLTDRNGYYFFQGLWARKWRNVIIKRESIYDFEKDYFWKLNRIWRDRSSDRNGYGKKDSKIFIFGKLYFSNRVRREMQNDRSSDGIFIIGYWGFYFRNESS